jgi:hypothetical protein
MNEDIEQINQKMDIITNYDIEVINDTFSHFASFSNNKIINKISKIVSALDLVTNYNKELNKTNSHIESTLVTGIGLVTETIVENVGIASAVTVGGMMSTGGPVGTACGIIVGGTIYNESKQFASKSKEVAKIATKKTIEIVQNVKSKLPKTAQKLIYECISEPVETSLKFIYDLSVHSIQIIKETITNIICDNWENITSVGKLIYSIVDSDNKKITVELNQNITDQILTYCHVYSNIDFTLDYHHIKNGYKSEFEQSYREFQYNFDNFQSNLSNLPSNVPTPYDKVKIIRPRTELFERYNFNNICIPNYTVTTSISNRGNNGLVCGGILFMVQIAIIF